MNMIRGTVAPERGDTGTRAAFRLMESGRRDPDPAAWLKPLPPVLWRPLSEEDRETHERLGRGHAEAAARATELAAKVRETEAADEQALRTALRSGRPAAEAEATCGRAAGRAGKARGQGRRRARDRERRRARAPL
jgi:hypothetical protein